MSACSNKKKITHNHRPTSHSSNINNIPSMPIFISSMTEKDTLTKGLDLLLQFKKTACFGFCPTFEFNLYSNGVACYQGLQHVTHEGNFYGLISESQWNEIKTKASNIKFSSMSNYYPTNEQEIIADLPLTITGINYTGEFKQVTDSHSAPAELKKFEEYLSNIVEKFIKEKIEKK